jgi:D-alanine-D-alanine ligase
MKIPLAVVIGGTSAEHEVSLLSGGQVLLNIDKKKYAVRAVVITRDGRYFCREIPDETIPSRESIASLDGLAPHARSGEFSGPFSPLDAKEIWASCKTAFLALHGDLGEDGRIQGMLDMFGIVYNGSGVLASALAMHKIKSKYLFLQGGLDTPPFSVYGKDHPETTLESLVSRHGFPCFVKCPQSGSSRLMDRARDRKALESLLAEYSACAEEILVETSVKGIEFTCPVLERPDGSLQALPPIEIRPKISDFFNYEAKYQDNGSEEIVPAPRSNEILAEIQKISLKAHCLLGCKGVSRTDMILHNNIFYVLEVNTLPGLTANSLLPRSFNAAGGSYSQLLDILIMTAYNRLDNSHQ